jgi:hypothetical protein
MPLPPLCTTQIGRRQQYERYAVHLIIIPEELEKIIFQLSSNTVTRAV